MDNRVPIVILIVYWIFVLKVGPKLMENRKPFQIKDIMLVYNFIQVVYSSALIWYGFQIENAFEWLKNFGCIPDKHYEPTYDITRMTYNCSWLYFFNKIVELLDTVRINLDFIDLIVSSFFYLFQVFFVLRKKQSHVSFLHVYHHSNMGMSSMNIIKDGPNNRALSLISVLSTFVFTKYGHAEQGILIGFLNSIVHIIMYSYYFLAALGPSVQKYLFWKRYVTKLQLLQFMMVITYFISLTLRGCKIHNVVTVYCILNGCLFWWLFFRFYKNAYYNSKAAKKLE